jgi:outer membrane protein
MMRIVKTIFVVMMCWGLMATAAQAADVAKIGTIDFQRILDTSSAGKFAQAELSKQAKNMDSDLRAQGKAIQDLKDKLDKEMLVIDKGVREEREREIRIKINDLKTQQRKFQRDMKEAEARVVRNIQNDLHTVVGEMAKKEGYLLVLDKKSGGVVYAPESIDITDKVIKAYNLVYANKMKKRN